MSLLDLYRDEYNKAISAVRSKNEEIGTLLRSGKELTDAAVVALMDEKSAIEEVIDQYGSLIRSESAQERAQREAETALEGYARAGWVAPKAVGNVIEERINSIVTPSLRKFAIDHPELCSDEYRTALSRYVRQSYRERKELPFVPFLEDAGLESRLMETVTDELGGYTVPPDVQDQILRNLATFAIIRGLASVTPTSSNLVEWVTVQRATGTSKGIYTGTFVGAMVPEVPGATAGEADLKFTRINIPVRKSRVIGWIGEDLVADEMVDILDLLRDEGAQNLAILEDSQFIKGTGGDGEVLGILNHPQGATPAAGEIDTEDVSGSTADTISNTTTNRGSESAILGLIDAVAAQYRVGPGVAMIGHSKTRTKIRGLVTPAGNFVWRDELAAEIEASGRAGSLEGIPFYISDHMAQDGTDANKVLLVGNFRYYRIVDRQRLTIRVSLEQKFDVEQVGLRINSRFGGHVTNPEAFAIGVV